MSQVCENALSTDHRKALQKLITLLEVVVKTLARRGCQQPVLQLCNANAEALFVQVARFDRRPFQADFLAFWGVEGVSCQTLVAREEGAGPLVGLPVFWTERDLAWRCVAVAHGGWKCQHWDVEKPADSDHFGALHILNGCMFDHEAVSQEQALVAQICVIE